VQSRTGTSETLAHNKLDEYKQNTTQKTKKMSNADPTKNRGWTQVFVKGT